MENDYELITKPNLGKRMLAGLIDYSFIFTYVGIMFYYYGEPNGDGSFSVSGLPGFSITIVWFFFTVVLELSMGATIGNKICKLRPVPKSDPRESLCIAQSFKRHLLDMFDLWPFGIFGIVLIKHTKFNQRLGDLWAKTIVLDINDPKQGLK